MKSDVHTFLNVNADAVTWVKDHVETRRTMRKSRRFRKTPYRVCRINRSRGGIPPSTKARWQWKLRISRWLVRMFPISAFVVEDIKAVTKKWQKKWNKNFSPLEVGKQWFYEELKQIAPVYLRQGYETKELRDAYGLKKTKNKLAEIFNAHCVDSWVLANWWVGGHIKPDNTELLCVTPLQFHRRQLHRLQPESGGLRKRYGGTLSLDFKRGGLIRHPKYGVCYVGGYLKNNISLHALDSGKRLTQTVKPSECRFLTYNSWRTKIA